MTDLIRMWKVTGLPEGPGSNPRPYTDSPGVLAYAIQHMLMCSDATDMIRKARRQSPDATPRQPFTKVLLTGCPSLVVASNEVDKLFFDSLLSGFTAFGPMGQDGTLQSYYKVLKDRFDTLTDEFGGESINLDALDEIDLSGVPAIFGSYRAEYYDIFQYQRAFTPARYLVGGTSPENGWNRSLAQRMLDIYEEGEGPVHELERWWQHASLSFAVPAVAANLGNPDL